jgi:hypothetical protein
VELPQLHIYLFGKKTTLKSDWNENKTMQKSMLTTGKWQKDKQRSTKHTHQSKDRVTGTG